MSLSGSRQNTVIAYAQNIVRVIVKVKNVAQSTAKLFFAGGQIIFRFNERRLILLKIQTVVRDQKPKTGLCFTISLEKALFA